MKRTLFLMALFAWGGCSSTSFVGKRVDNFTAYYNTFYNARTAYDKAEKALEQPEKAIDRDTYLFVFEPGSPGAGVKDFESAIKKSADVLRGHPNSKWVDDALLLIGKSYYYMGNTVGAQQKFREVIDRQSSLEDESRFWLGLALMSAGSFDEAGAHLQESLDRDKVSKKWLARMRLALGEMYVRQERWEEAAEQLKAGVDRADDRELSSRGQFLLGQVYETIGMFDLASRAYRDVTRFKPIYELEYAARFNAVRVEGEHGVPEEALQSLRKMERDGKNFTYRAELAYLRGRILMADRRSQDAYDTWFDVLYNSDGNITSIRGKTHYHLGLLFRDQFIDFDIAAAHFDTASTSLSRGVRPNAAGRTETLESSPSAITDAAELADVFGSFASFHADVQHFDSLLALGSLDDEAFRERIEEIRRQRAAEIVEERRSQERRAAEASFRRTGADVGSAGAPRTGAAGGSADYATAGFLYHRDRSRVQDGLLGFFDRWGERPVVPNWRRRAAITEGRGPGVAEADPESGAPTIPVGTVTGDVTTDALLRSVDVDISEIPRSADAQAQMRRRRAGARYELANTLFLSMARPDSAAAWYRLVFEESEDPEISARALYALGEVQRSTGDQESADAIYADVLERYPDSEVASRAGQRLGLESAVTSVAEADVLNDMYRAAFEQWVDGSFDDGMRGMLALAAAYPDSVLSGRSLLAAGAIYVDWAEVEGIDITEPIAIEIPDSLWIQLGLMESPTLPEARGENTAGTVVSLTAATDSISAQASVAPPGDGEVAADSTIAVTDSLQRGFEAADIPSGRVANAQPDSLEQSETVQPVTTMSPGTQPQSEIESRSTIHLLDLYTLISTRYSGSAYAQRATGLTAALKERMKPAVDSSLVSRADTTGVPLDREADIAVEQKETIPSISERQREDAEEAVVPGVQRPAEALERDLLVRPPTVADTTTYDIADVEPRLVGGDGALQRMFRYPDTAAEGQISGRVELRFVVDERGRILEPSIADSVGAGCDEEALRVIRLTRFRPATIDGRAVRFRMVLDVDCAPDPRP